MKSIRDDKQYLEAERVMNELAGKRDAIEKELNEVNVAAFATNREPESSDPVEEALQLEPGVKDTERQDLLERVPILRAQSDQLRKAMGVHQLKLELARREAGYRVLAQNMGSYVGHARELLDLVDALIETNKALRADFMTLWQQGAQDGPEVQFPSFGLAEQLPYWREDLHEQIQLLNHIARVHSS